MSTAQGVGTSAIHQNNDPLAFKQPESTRTVPYDPELWEMYKKHMASFWTAEKIGPF